MFDDSAPRTAAWLRRWAAAPVRPSPRGARYLAVLLSRDAPLRLDQLRPGLARGTAYDISRGGAALIGRKAFLFRTPGTPLHRNPAVFDAVLDGLRRFRERQDRSGNFACGDAWSGHLPHHSHAWRLEPMIWARLWLEPDLAPRDRAWIDAMLRRGADRLLRMARQAPTDTLQYCNRGLVWSAVTTLCGLYFDDRRFLDAAAAHAPRILANTIRPDGQVLEHYLHYQGGGPDSGYSLTSWIYTILYRLLSGNRAFDDRLVRALQWQTDTLTRTGWPVATGASVRHANLQVCEEDLLPGYELLAEQEPFFDTLADRLLGRGKPHSQGHACHPCLWALLLHRPRPAAPAPAWYRHRESHFEHGPCQYSLIRHRYQTGVVWRGLFPFQGLQTFALAGETPILHPNPAASGTRSGGVDTAARNVEAGPSGWELFRRTGGPGDGYEPAAPATWMLARRGALWECLLFTPDSAVVVVGGGAGRRLTRWALRAEPGRPPRLDPRAGRVAFPGRKAMLHHRGGRARLAGGAETPVLEVRSGTTPVAFGFGDAALRLEGVDRNGRRLRFSDRSGRYAMDLAGVLDEAGHLDRRPERWYRLTRLGPAPRP